MIIQWKKLHELGRLNEPAYRDDAGLDLVVVEPIRIRPTASEMVMLPCGIAIALPPAVACLVVGRSSMYKDGLMIASTLIDPGYRGPLFVVAYNLNHHTITIPAGTRVAQLLPVNVLAGLAEIVQVDELPASERGERGFGSS